MVVARLGDGGFAGCFSYSRSQGRYAGVAVEGGGLISRADVLLLPVGEGAVLGGEDLEAGHLQPMAR